MEKHHLTYILVAVLVLVLAWHFNKKAERTTQVAGQ